MAIPKSNPSQQPAPGDEEAPRSQVRVKPQGVADRGVLRRAIGDTLREASAPAVDQLMARAEAEGWSREQIVDGILAIQREYAKGLISQEDLDALARQTRKLVLGTER